jgi:hypothetical protein
VRRNPHRSNYQFGHRFGLCIPITYYWCLGNKTRRLFRQQKIAQVESNVTWNESGILYKNSLGTFSPTWNTYHSWRGEKVGIMLYLNDSSLHLIPQRALNDEERADIESILTARGLRKR